MAREITVLVNPTAGRGRGARLADPVTQRLRDAGLKASWEAGRDASEAADLARRAAARGVDGLVVIGGDGMIHLTLDAVAESETPLGIIPAGTGNDLARNLGIPLHDPMAATDIVIAGHTSSQDLGRTEVGWFSTVLCAGFDSRVAERVSRMSWPRGRLRYDLATVLELRAFQPRRYELDLDGDSQQTEAMLVAIGVTSSYGGGLRICEGADPADGLFDVVVVRPVTRRVLVRMFPKLSKGTHIGHPAVVQHRASKVRLASDGLVSYADGERMGILPLTIECVPRALRVFGPASTPRPDADPATT
ncbi:MAG TPA: diacylglycerol kinase [Actinopolymorphaceae bacterium]